MDFRAITISIIQKASISFSELQQLINLLTNKMIVTYFKTCEKKSIFLRILKNFLLKCKYFLVSYDGKLNVIEVIIKNTTNQEISRIERLISYKK